MLKMTMHGKPARYSRSTAAWAHALGAVLLLASGCELGPIAALARGGSEGQRTREIIARHGCGGCHTIPGVDGADSSVGPPLTGLGRRVYVGGRVNSLRNLAEFIQNPSAERPSTMPNVGIRPEDAEQVAAYLTRL